MKKLVFSLIATVFMSVLSVSAQSKPKNFFQLSDIGFGKISSYAGPCVEGPGACSGSIVDDNLNFQVGVAKESETVVTYAFSRSFYENNATYLSNGLYVGVLFSLPGSLTQKIGITGEFVVAKGTYPVTQKDGFYFVSLRREK